MAETPEKIVEVPGVGNVSFPGGMADGAISEAIKRHLAKQKMGTSAWTPVDETVSKWTPVNSIDDLINHPDFAGMSLPDKNKMLMTFPEFAQHTPQDRQKMLDVIHYGAAPKPAEDTSSIWGGMKSALGEQAKGAVKELKTPLSYFPMPGPLSVGSEISAIRSQYPLIKRAAQETWEGIRHPLAPPAPLTGLHRAEALMPIVGPMAASVEEPAMAGRTREAIGRGLVYGSELAAPVLGGRLLKATEPIRGRVAERTAQSLLGPEPKGTPFVSRPAPALVAEAPVALSRRSLTAKIGKTSAEYRATIQRTLRASEEAPPEPLEPIVRNAVKPLMDEARDLGHPEIADRIQAWAERYLAAHPAEVPLDELYNMRRRISSNQPLFKGTSEEFSDLKTAKKEVYRAMNQALDRRMPGFRAITQRESGLIQARQMLKEQARREAGGPLLPSPRLYGGESAGGGGFMATRIGMPIPFETLGKTLAIKALGKRLPLAEPTPAGAAPPGPPRLLAPLGPPEPGAVTPQFPMPSFVKVTDFSQGAQEPGAVTPPGVAPAWNGIERRATERNPLVPKTETAPVMSEAAPPSPYAASQKAVEDTGLLKEAITFLSTGRIPKGSKLTWRWIEDKTGLPMDDPANVPKALEILKQTAKGGPAPVARGPAPALNPWAAVPQVAPPPELGTTLPGFGQAVLENRAAADTFRGQELGREFNVPRENLSAATGEMERESPLFRETGAGGQEGLFSRAGTARPAIAAPQPIPESRQACNYSETYS